MPSPDQWPTKLQMLAESDLQSLPPGRAARHKLRFSRSVSIYGPPPDSMWLVCGNIVPIRAINSDDSAFRNGLRLFSGHSKVTVFKFWRNASPVRVSVVGRHRITNTYVSAVVETRYLFNLRASLVRSPYIIAQHWQSPEQRFYYGRDKEAALSVLAELEPFSAGSIVENEA